MQKDLSKLFNPGSIAVIGASRSPEKVGSIVLKNILDSKFPGKVYAVNPNATDINGTQCFSHISDVPEIPDLAIIAIPAEKVSEELNQIGEKGTKNIVVLSAGFKETGPDGEKLEEDLSKIADKYNLNILGPNCLGFINNDLPLNATFGQTESVYGNLRFISQSGAIATSLVDWCRSIGLGFSKLFTLGNKAVVDECDVLTYFQSNPNTQPIEEGLSSVHPIGMYLESVKDGVEFMKLTSDIGKTDPIFIIKPGKTKAAAQAMQSHTGAIAGEDDVLDAAFEQTGIYRCDTLEDFFDLSRAFSWEDAPGGNRIAVISNAGGPAVISADAVSASGLMLAEFSDDLNKKLQGTLPRSASILNPIDVLGDALADRYAKASEIILSSDQADTLLIILTPQMMTQIEKTAQIVGDLSKKYKKPIFCSFIGGTLVNEGEIILNQAKIPSFRFPERAISAIGAMWKWKKRQLQIQKEEIITAEISLSEPPQVKTVISEALKNGQVSLDALQANEIAAVIGIPTPATAGVASFDEAKDFVKMNGWPVVLKLTSPAILHKGSLGGVITNIWNEEQLGIAWNELNYKKDELPEENKKGLRFQIQKDVTSGIEVIVGTKHDPTFGPVLLFGAGGELAEIVEDKNIKVLPVDRNRVIDLVAKSKVAKLLKNEPGEPPYALDKLYDLIVRFTTLIPLIPDATDIEINPVIVTHNDVWAVDVKMLLAGAEAKKAVGPKFHTATLKNTTVLASTFRYLEFESEEPLKYLPGQYISVKVAPTRINSYSIAGGDGKPGFSLLVDTSPGGPGSKFFENIKPGDKIAYLGPFGTFTLKENDGAKRLLFLGTGSGCSPLHCILNSALNNPAFNIPIHLYFGLRYSNDIFWKEYFEKLAMEHPNFHFSLVLSKPDENWKGQTGHITDILQKEIPDASDSSAYLCGNPQMVEESMNILKNSKCPEKRIYTEKF